MKNVAIVGGGPGGLMTAYLLEEKYKGSCRISLFEASHRTGGKINTAHFSTAPVPYEAGTAELYNYDDIGPDPLLNMIESFGLATIPMKGRAVVLDGRILRNTKDIERLCGPATLQAIRDLRQRAVDALPVDSWYEGNSHRDNAHPWAGRSCEEVLDEVADDTARKYLRVAAHSDLATEPHLTNGLNGLKNFLMDVPGYIRLYTIVGGIERLVSCLRDRLGNVRFELNSAVVRVEKNADAYRLFYRRERKVQQEDFDAVFVALPHNWLGSVEWGGERLRKAMTRFIAYYDRPGHYLRVSILFKTPFWRKVIRESWFMLDAFGGCCVYDESARYDTGDYGVLSWLLAGNSALTLCSLDEQALTAQVLESLPEKLYAEAQAQFLEAKVHRWPASVSAQPGGFPVRNTRAAHVPEPIDHPGLFTIGDYLFDSTLNGVLDSADCATDLFQAWVVKQQFLGTAAATQSQASPLLNGHMVRRRMVRSVLGDSAHQNGHSPKCFDAKYVRDLIKVAWKTPPPYRLLDAGSANGTTLGAFEELGIEAWGIESDSLLHSLTPAKWQERNTLGNLHQLPFPDEHFDFVYATCLELIPEDQLDRAVKELYRVTRRGVIFAGVTTDLEPEAFTRYRLLRGPEVLMTLWEWSELFVANGFKVSISDEDILERLETCEERYEGENSIWYSDQDSLRYCFYTKDTFKDVDEDDDEDDEDDDEEVAAINAEAGSESQPRKEAAPAEAPPSSIEIRA